QNVPFDDPVERSAVKNVGGAARHHPRRVVLLGGKSAAALLLQSRSNPLLEILDRFGADAELDEVDGHGHRLWRERLAEPRGADGFPASCGAVFSGGVI